MEAKETPSHNFCEEACVACVDILGFKEMTNDIGPMKRNAKILSEAIVDMKQLYLNNELSEMEKGTRIIRIQGADSLFLIFEEHLNNCYIAIRQLIKLQYQLASKGIYLRGAVATGNMYIDEDNSVYFGEAWNRAVHEEKNARYPRIVIASSIAKTIEEVFSAMHESVGEFCIDRTDQKYVLNFCFCDSSDNGCIKMMIDELESNFLRYKSDEEIARKHLWMARFIEQNTYQADKEAARGLVKKIEDALLS